MYTKITVHAKITAHTKVCTKMNLHAKITAHTKVYTKITVHPKITAHTKVYTKITLHAHKYMAFMLGNHLTFIDSFQFMSSSLEKLVSNLPAKHFKYTSKEFENEKFELIW